MAISKTFLKYRELITCTLVALSVVSLSGASEEKTSYLLDNKEFVKEMHDEALDLVDMAVVNPRILLDIRYATSNNFTGQAIYEKPKCYLRRNVAQQLSKVQDFLSWFRYM